MKVVHEHNLQQLNNQIQDMKHEIDQLKSSQYAVSDENTKLLAALHENELRSQKVN